LLALWLQDRKLRLRDDLSVPVPEPGEALIRIAAAGICSTDLEMLAGYYPYTGIPGHEFVGVVERADSDRNWVGKRVVGEINISCGKCPACRRGDQTHCQGRSAIGIKGHHGAFAQYLCLPIKNLHQVPESVPDEAAVFTEPLAAALEILEQVRIQPDARVLVVGAGRLGQLIARVLDVEKCNLAVVVRHDNQVRALRRVGIKALYGHQVPEAEMDLVVDATGSPSGFDLATYSVRPRGKIVLKSTYAGSMAVDLSSLVVNEITLIGSRCGPFNPALELLASRQVDPTPLISKVYQLEDGVSAYRKAREAGVFKVIFKLDFVDVKTGE
jgi:2-desacetyl-2-hydroxyethyl bacteriochlorophyllide A dehydrogenase